MKLRHEGEIRIVIADANEQQLDRIESLLRHLVEQGERMAATLDQVLETVTSSSTVVESISQLVKGLKQQLADALAGTTLPPAVQAKVDAIFSTAEANKAKLAEALLENTPEQP